MSGGSANFATSAASIPRRALNHSRLRPISASPAQGALQTRATYRTSSSDSESGEGSVTVSARTAESCSSWLGMPTLPLPRSIARPESSLLSGTSHGRRGMSIRWTLLRPQGRAKVSNPLRTDRRDEMRFMVIVKADKSSEAGVLPDQKILTEMGKFNEQLVKAGVMLAGEGLHSSKDGARVRFDGKKRTVTDGPFAETKELIAGYWLWQCKSKEEAIEWVKRCPNPMPGEESEIEIRQVFEAEDFGAEFTPELREQEARQRARVEQLRKEK